MSILSLQQQLIHMAAGLTRSRYFGRILRLCDKQKTISTSKLIKIIEDIEESQRFDAAMLSRVNDSISSKNDRIAALEVALQAYARYANKNAMERDIRLLSQKDKK